MNTGMAQVLHLSSTALMDRIRYRHGFPFIMSAILAVFTIGLCRIDRATSIWTFALLALIATAFALLFGGRFRTFFITITVMPPFLVVFVWVLRLRAVVPDFPIKAVTEHFLYFVAAPILLVWIVAMLLGRNEREA